MRSKPFGPGSNHANWPPVLAFSRVIRNAIAHDGHFRIDSTAAPTLCWGNISIGPAQNGQRLFETTLAPGDLILLLFDLSEELDREGAPNPI